MKITLMLDDKVIFSKEIFEPKKENKSIADAFAEHLGTTEYNGVVATIQKWFYGRLVKQPWCCTSISYFLNQLGLLDKIGGKKQENVNQLRIACQEAAKKGLGEYYDKAHIPNKICKDDILMFEWDDKEMSNTSSKHATVAYRDSADDIIECIGGNQADSICVKKYSRSQLYALYRIK